MGIDRSDNGRLCNIFLIGSLAKGIPGTAVSACAGPHPGNIPDQPANTVFTPAREMGLSGNRDQHADYDADHSRSALLAIIADILWIILIGTGLWAGQPVCQFGSGQIMENRTA